MSQFTDISNALSVEARVKILQMLKSKRLCVNAITQHLGISQSAVSQHLRILKSVGLVKDEKIGYWVHYSINPKVLKKYKRLMISVLTTKK